jgi:transcriptional regulator with XRE-family HTH domain
MPVNNKADYLKSLGENIRKLKTERLLSLRELDTLCCVYYSHLLKIEKGEVNVTLLTIHHIAKGLDVKPTALMEFAFNGIKP